MIRLIVIALFTLCVSVAYATDNGEPVPRYVESVTVQSGTLVVDGRTYRLASIVVFDGVEMSSTRAAQLLMPGITIFFDTRGTGTIYTINSGLM